jgi:hypothetical protein
MIYSLLSSYKTAWIPIEVCSERILVLLQRRKPYKIWEILSSRTQRKHPTRPTRREPSSQPPPRRSV